jgi:hypothetical protein
MVLVIPDSVFAGTSIHTLDLRLQTKENGTQAMGPEALSSLAATPLPV